jgi:RNA polymerase sigma-70 factor (ECF subfamily)
VNAALISKAKAGDEDAFRRVVEPFRRELLVHCYRILGSRQDAEDALQETLLAAWRGLSSFQERASLRTWLYRVATSRCLNALRAAGRRPQMESPMEQPPDLPEPTRLGESIWLEPYPDALLDDLEETPPGPEAIYEAREAISLAFVTALQLLPPRQRVVLILRDVLGFRATEAASMLETTEESVTSALKRARATLERRLQAPAGAFENSNMEAVVALLSKDVRLTMPPLPLEYSGREQARRFFTAVSLHGQRRYRIIPTRANGQPAFGMYIRDPGATVFHAIGLIVLTLAGSQISEMARFDTSVLPAFRLPRKLPP